MAEKIKFFDPKEIENLSGTTLQAAAQTIKQRMDARRTAYHQIRNQALRAEQWNTVQDAFEGFEPGAWSEWNKKWSTVHRAANPAQTIEFFKEGQEIFNRMEEKISGLITPLSGEAEEIGAFKSEVLQQVSEKIVELQQEISKQVSIATNQILKIKSEVNLGKDFQTNISTELTTSILKGRYFFFAVIASTLLLALIIIATFFIPQIKELEWYYQVGIRLLILAFGIFLIQFFHLHYRFHMLARLKYGHLQSLLGGGASHITTLLGANEEFKGQTYKQITNLFLDNSDLAANFNSKNQPSPDAIGKATSLIKELASALSKLKSG